MPLESLRPSPGKRTFISPLIEQVIAETAAQIADPELAWLFQNCLPNTLDTTVCFSPDGSPDKPDNGKSDTFIITGDIDAMWLRDSTNQVWPYLPYANQCPKLRSLFQGLIRRQAQCILLDPYANDFYPSHTKKSQWETDHTEMKSGVHERKYELDSLASVLRLATGYFEVTGDQTPFDEDVLQALGVIVETIKAEQAGTPEQIHPRYSFARTTANATDTLPNGSHGHPCRRTGMSRSPFRPSDDSSVFQYHVPANAMASVMLRKTGEMLGKLQSGAHTGGTQDLAVASLLLSYEIHRGLRSHAIQPHPTLGPIFAYEVDGYGSCLFMDDANAPSLLSLPYLGYCAPTDTVYQHTRRFLLSTDNPYYHEGSAGAGIGSPHVGMGWIWPMSIIMQALTSTNDAEILTCLRTLKKSNAGTGFMHEAFWMNDPARFTRPWFAWANTCFGELILNLAKTRPHLLTNPL